jgi:hypothetical protein
VHCLDFLEFYESVGYCMHHAEREIPSIAKLYLLLLYHKFGMNLL